MKLIPRPTAPAPSLPISEPQRKTMTAIKEFISKRGFPPTMSEIGEILGISSPSAYQQIDLLTRKGYLRREAGKARGLVIARDPDISIQPMMSIPLVGRVAAGQPILAVENVVGQILVDGSVASRGRCFALTVQGESMLDAGIRDGDIVIVRQQSVAESGDVVVALLHDEATVKRLSIRDEHIELQPENPAFKPISIEPDDDFRILGKVVGIRSVEPDEKLPTGRPRRTRRKRGKT